MLELTEILQLNEIGERKSQQDSIFPSLNCIPSTPKLFIVCDGIGGHFGGEIASQTTCSAISEFFYRTEMFTPFNDYFNDALKYTVIKFKQKIGKKPKLKLMGTTLSVAYIVDDGIWVTWCGDSPILHIRDGKILWRSKEHNVMQQLLEEGKTSYQEALDHPDRNVLLKSINAYDKSIEVDVHFINDMQSNDYLLLCTDGLLENISEDVLLEILNDDQEEKDKLKLFKQHCENWTMDNYSMVLLRTNQNVI